eukprot:TRINITY_DN7675_c0_g4_i1.p1 TRINITY_DN7675_c0_g4~~TRINITY_DN7675_c0_g4_i1.p1  ORF type:complete len:762 (+),score=79.94 TRINITY_DN7675_c0_g4_i1:100-2385(+)
MPADVEAEEALARLVGAIGGLQRMLQPTLVKRHDAEAHHAAAALDAVRVLSPQPNREARHRGGAAPDAYRALKSPLTTPRPQAGITPGSPSVRSEGRPPLAPRGPSPQRQPVCAAPPPTVSPPPSQRPSAVGGPPLPLLPLHRRLWSRFADPSVCMTSVGGVQAASSAAALVARFTAFVNDVLRVICTSHTALSSICASDAMSVPALNAAFSAAVNEPNFGVSELMALTRVREADAQVLGSMQASVVCSGEGARFLWEGAVVDLSDPRALQWALGWVSAVAQLCRGSPALPSSASQCVALKADAAALTGHSALAEWVATEAPGLLASWSPSCDDGVAARLLTGSHLALCQLILESTALSFRAAVTSYVKACQGVSFGTVHHDDRACRTIVAIRRGRAGTPAAVAAQPPPPAPAPASHSPKARPRRDGKTARPRSRSLTNDVGTRLRGGTGAALMDSAVAKDTDAGTGAASYVESDVGVARKRVQGAGSDRDRAYFFVSEFLPKQKLGKGGLGGAHRESSPAQTRPSKSTYFTPCNTLVGSAAKPHSSAAELRSSPRRRVVPPQADMKNPWGSPEVPNYSRPRGRRVIMQNSELAHGSAVLHQTSPLQNEAPAHPQHQPQQSCAAASPSPRARPSAQTAACPFDVGESALPTQRTHRRAVSAPQAEPKQPARGRQLSAPPLPPPPSPTRGRRGVTAPSAPSDERMVGAALLPAAGTAPQPAPVRSRSAGVQRAPVDQRGPSPSRKRMVCASARQTAASGVVF